MTTPRIVSTDRDLDAGMAYATFSEGSSSVTVDVGHGISVDFDSDGRILGIEYPIR